MALLNMYDAQKVSNQFLDYRVLHFFQRHKISSCKVKYIYFHYFSAHYCPFNMPVLNVRMIIISQKQSYSILYKCLKRLRYPGSGLISWLFQSQIWLRNGLSGFELKKSSFEESGFQSSFHLLKFQLFRSKSGFFPKIAIFIKN